MTEAEWLACEDAYPMVDHVGDSASDRKLRLFAVACCRRLWLLLTDPRSRAMVTAAERYADGAAGDDEIAVAGIDAGRVNNRRLDAEHYAAEAAAALGWRADDGYGSGYHAKLLWYDADYVLGAKDGRLCHLLRDVIGNPFRPVVRRPAPLTTPVPALANAAYDERLLPAGHLDPARLAVLSDALEEAGCADDALLSHLRSPGPHVRGCWALDVVLGKE